MNDSLLSKILAVALVFLSIFSSVTHAEFFAYIPLEKSKGGMLEDGAVVIASGKPNSDSGSDSGNNSDQASGPSTEQVCLSTEMEKKARLEIMKIKGLKFYEMTWNADICFLQTQADTEFSDNCSEDSEAAAKRARDAIDQLMYKLKVSAGIVNMGCKW